MTMAWVELQQFGMILAGGPIADRLAVAHADGIGRIGPDGAAILDVNRGHAIARRSHDEGVVEADGVGTGSDLAVPIRSTGRSQSKMPLADHAGGIAGPLKD